MTYQIFFGIKEIFLIGKIESLMKKYSDHQKNLSDLESKQLLIQNFPRVILETFAILIFLITLIYLFYQNIENKEIIVIMSFYLAIAYRVMPSFNKIFINYQ